MILLINVGFYIATVVHSMGLGNTGALMNLDGRTLYRVRVGPIPSVNEFDRVLTRMRSLGLSDAQLAAE